MSDPPATPGSPAQVPSQAPGQADAAGQPRTWRRALQESALAVIIFCFLSWAVHSHHLGWLSDSLADAQDKAYDTLAALEHHFPSPLAPPPGTPRVVFVDIDDATIQAANISPYLFHRGLLAELLQKLSAAQPKAIYVDLNLSASSQEPNLTRQGLARFPRSPGDEALLKVLTAPRAFPVLLSQPAVLGENVMQLGGSTCWVTPAVITDSGDTVRRIPRRWQDGPYPASEALLLAAQPQGFQCPEAKRAQAPPKDIYRTALYGEPIIFHDIPAMDAGTSTWPGLSVINAQSLLTQDGTQLEPGALVVVGRTDRNSQDMHDTAVGDMAGVKLHLNALMTLLTYRHPVIPLDPVVSALLAFAGMLLAIVVAPILSTVLTQLLGRLGVKREFGDVFEHPIMWGLLFGCAFVFYRYGGRFLDFALPIVSLELARLALSRQTSKLVTRTLKMAKILN
ncbi:CHASE2 domain-containing protein (plasmid) [Deinococcus taeanensis]|uniref:CHASE2 domain-containing protein n=1 Tax=Deinococcus taeanensis TaxID=2737050 RepID=UPI001CDBFB8D|nr:CHASE2 domain-containing protein [Deinococcus taeanensis]UBV44122.1 CHASE2 domain-containing protein [Deinococcus taeanensis]